MTPVCLDFNDYVEALLRMGFKKTRDEYNDRGWLVQTSYGRNDVVVIIRERREADQPDAKRTHACLEFISFG